MLQKETYRHSYAVTARRGGAHPHFQCLLAGAVRGNGAIKAKHRTRSHPGHSNTGDATPHADYMYTLNLASPERRWSSVEPLYKAAQETFTLTTPGKDFVPPEKDPWRFW